MVSRGDELASRGGLWRVRALLRQAELKTDLAEALLAAMGKGEEGWKVGEASDLLGQVERRVAGWIEGGADRGWARGGD